MSEISKEEKRKYQIVSKILWVLTRIANVCCWIGVGCVALATIAVSIISPNVEIDKSKKEITLFDNSTSYTIRDKEFEIGEGDDKVIVKDNSLTVLNDGDDVVSVKLSNSNLDQIEEFIEDKLPRVLAVLPFVLIGVTALLVCTAIMLNHAANIFKNIAKKKTPFIKDNITRTEKAIKYMITTVILAFCIDLVMTLATSIDASMTVEVTSISTILITYVALYIFKSGYQLDGGNKKEAKEEEKED